MIKEVFLSCALSLSHPAAWKPPLTNGPQLVKKVVPEFTEDVPFFSVREFVNESRMINRLLDDAYPNHQFIFVPNKFHIVPPGYIPVPIKWRGQTIYRRQV